MPPRLGFIGLGLMGKPMAARLLEAGYTVAVHNRSRGAVHELETRGAVACMTSREVAARSDIIITMLPDAPDVSRAAAPDRVEGFRRVINGSGSSPHRAIPVQNDSPADIPIEVPARRPRVGRTTTPNTVYLGILRHGSDDIGPHATVPVDN